MRHIDHANSCRSDISEEAIGLKSQTPRSREGRSTSMDGAAQSSSQSRGSTWVTYATPRLFCHQPNNSAHTKILVSKSGVHLRTVRVLDGAVFQTSGGSDTDPLWSPSSRRRFLCNNLLILSISMFLLLDHFNFHTLPSLPTCPSQDSRLEWAGETGR